MKRVALQCFALAVALTARPISAQQLEIRFLDVGQGDAALIQSGTKILLIDAGGSAGVVSYLRAFHIDTIDLVIASHNHADHIGGMSGVLHSTVVRFYMDNGVPQTTATYQRPIQAAQPTAAQYRTPPTAPLPSSPPKCQILDPP